MVPDSSGGSLLRADAQVIWYPSRTAAEYVDPTRYHVLAITVTVDGRKMHTIHRVVTSQADIARLAEALDRSPAEPPVAINCPAIFVTYQLALSVSRHSRPVVMIWTNSIGCGGTAITVDGRPQPALADRGAECTAAMPVAVARQASAPSMPPSRCFQHRDGRVGEARILVVLGSCRRRSPRPVRRCRRHSRR